MLTLGPGTTGPMYVYFFHDAKGFNEADVGYLLIPYIGAGIIGAPIWGRLARRFGKHRTVQIACVCYGITQTILIDVPHVTKGYHFWPDGVPTAIGMFAVGFCASAFILLIRSMVADVIDEVKLETRRDLTSLLYSMVTTTTKIGQAVTVSIVLPTLAFFGYEGQEGAHNTARSIFVLETMYVLVPIALVWFGGAMLFGYKLDAARHAEIRQALGRARVRRRGRESLVGPLSARSTRRSQRRPSRPARRAHIWSVPVGARKLEAGRILTHCSEQCPSVIHANEKLENHGSESHVLSDFC